MKDKSLAFTGHRYLKGQDQDAWAHGALELAVGRAVESGITWFTSGGAPYWDWWFLDACKQASKQLAGGHGLPDGVVISMALPFRGFLDFYAKKRRDDDIYIRNHLIDGSVEPIVVVHDEPTPKARPRMLQLIHARNRWLVDNHDAVMTVYDGRKSGGTFATLQYAKKKGKPILWLNPVTKTERWVTE